MLGVAKNGCGREKLKRSTEEMTLAKKKTRKEVSGCSGLFRAVQGCSGLFRARWTPMHAKWCICKVLSVAPSRLDKNIAQLQMPKERRNPTDKLTHWERITIHVGKELEEIQ